MFSETVHTMVSDERVERQVERGDGHTVGRHVHQRVRGDSWDVRQIQIRQIRHLKDRSTTMK